MKRLILNLPRPLLLKLHSFSVNELSVAIRMDLKYFLQNSRSKLCLSKEAESKSPLWTKKQEIVNKKYIFLKKSENKTGLLKDFSGVFNLLGKF